MIKCVIFSNFSVSVVPYVCVFALHVCVLVCKSLVSILASLVGKSVAQ